jgi:hypothetical protein
MTLLLIFAIILIIHKMADGDKWINRLLDYKIVRIIAISLVIFFGILLVWDGIRFFNRTDKGEHAKFFWMENNMDVIHDTIKVISTIYEDTCIEKPAKIIYRNENKSNSKDNNTFNNNAPNSGIQGNIVTVTLEKRLTSDDKNYILSRLKELNVSPSRGITIIYKVDNAFVNDVRKFLQNNNYENLCSSFPQINSDPTPFRIKIKEGEQPFCPNGIDIEIGVV